MFTTNNFECISLDICRITAELNTESFNGDALI